MRKVSSLNWPFHWFVKHSGRSEGARNETLPINLRSGPSNPFACVESDLFVSSGYDHSRRA